MQRPDYSKSERRERILGSIDKGNEPGFSPWAKWDRRSELPHLKSPGIYAVAIDCDLHSEPFSWRPSIAYFGMTNSASGLAGRLKQFDKALAGKPGHGGALRFLYDYDPSNDLRDHLYVSVWGFDCNVRSHAPKDLRIMGEICKAEYDCFARFVELFGRLPKYNDKTGSPKRPL